PKRVRGERGQGDVPDLGIHEHLFGVGAAADLLDEPKGVARGDEHHAEAVETAAHGRERAGHGHARRRGHADDVRAAPVKGEPGGRGAWRQLEWVAAGRIRWVSPEEAAQEGTGAPLARLPWVASMRIARGLGWVAPPASVGSAPPLGWVFPVRWGEARSR